MICLRSQVSLSHSQSGFTSVSFDGDVAFVETLPRSTTSSTIPRGTHSHSVLITIHDNSCAHFIARLDFIESDSRSMCSLQFTYTIVCTHKVVPVYCTLLFISVIMADTTCPDDFLGHNPPISDHNDNGSSDDSSDDNLVLGAQSVDYTPLEHVHENRSNRGRGSVRRRLCSEPATGSCQ